MVVVVVVGRHQLRFRITDCPPHYGSERGIEHILEKDIGRVLRRDSADLKHGKSCLHLQTDRLGRGIRSKLKEAMVLGD